MKYKIYMFLCINFYWPLDSNRAVLGKILIEKRDQKSGDQRGGTGGAPPPAPVPPPSFVPFYHQNFLEIRPVAFRWPAGSYFRKLVFSNFGILDIPSWLHLQFFMQNPNLQSELTESSVQGPKFRKTEFQKPNF